MFNMLKISVPIIASLIGVYAVDNIVNTPEKPIIRDAQMVMDNPKRPYVTLDITSNPLDKNVFYVSGFEDGDYSYSYRYSHFPEGHNRREGGQTRVNSDKSEGSYSTKIVDTYSNGNYDKGYGVNGEHRGYEPYSVLQYEDRVYLPDNANLSITADVKADKKAIFTSTGVGGKVDKPPQWGKRVFTKSAKKGDTTIYMSGVDSEIEDILQKGDKMYVALSDAEMGEYEYGYIVSANVSEGTVTLSKPLEQDFKAGDAVLEHMHVNPVEFSSVEVKGRNKWETIQMNGVVDSSKYTTSKRGIKYWWETETAGTAYVDNIRFGYANKLRIIKDDKVVYEGYDNTFKDREIRDYKGPEKIESIQTSKTLVDGNNYEVSVNFEEPKDRGTEYKYKVQAIFDNRESEYSDEIVLNAFSGLDGYSYVINSDPDGSPDDIVDTRSTTIREVVPNTGQDLYIHIRAIDKAGNPSRTLRKKIDGGKTDLNVSNVNNKPQLQIAFTSPGADYSYSIYRKEDDGEYSKIISGLKDSRYIDDSAIDKKKPSVPNIDNYIVNKDKQSFDFNVNSSDDLGTKYSYYVETYSNDGALVSTSNIVKFEAKSGIKGISFELSSDSNTSVNDTIENIPSGVISIPYSEGKKFLVAKAIDNNGNFSDNIILKAFDDEKPEISLRLTNYNPTKENVSIIITARDNTGVDSILLPDGSSIKRDSLNYSVVSNGVYSFGVKDIFNNITVKSIEVSNIDKNKPSVEVIKNPNTEWSKEDVNITISSSD